MCKKYLIHILSLVVFSIIQMINSPCKGFLCWESQLVLESKIKLVRIYNRFRGKVASGKCKICYEQYANIFKLKWCWYFEAITTALLSSDCPDISFSKVLIKEEHLIIDNAHMICELAVGIFKQKTEHQTDMLDSLAEMLEDNVMLDFNSVGVAETYVRLRNRALVFGNRYSCDMEICFTKIRNRRRADN